MRFLLLCFVLGSSTTFAREVTDADAELLFEPVDSARSRTVPVKVYLPDADSPQPVIVFSHGLGGSRNNSPYLGKHWAGAGYVAVFVQHPGSDADVWKSVARAERMSALKKAASLHSALDRFADIPFVLDQLDAWNTEEGHALFGRLDLDYIGMTGHSFGAGTTQAMMGQKYPGGRDVQEARIDAFLPMSPSDGKAVNGSAAFGHITSPVLFMTGTEDGSPIDPTTDPASRRIPYASVPEGDAFELVFEGGDHMAFSGRTLTGEKQRQSRTHPAIQRISTKFWDAYLRNDEEARAWLKSERVKSDAALKEEDIWQWK